MLALPLLALYEAVLFASNSPTRNRFDFISHWIAKSGQAGPIIFNSVLICACIVAIIYLNRNRRMHPTLFVPMLAESFVYAIAMGAVVIYAMNFAVGLLQTNAQVGELLLKIGLAVGAGVYEEIAFRLLLLGLGFLFLRRVIHWHSGPAYVTAVIFAAAVFSLCHFNIPSFDNFEANAFFFRFGAGIVLGAIFCLRGIGVAIYTHALYNVLLLLKGAS